MIRINQVFVIGFLLLFSCTSTSMEFRSAKSATRAEKDLKRGEEWGLKALESDIDKDNALVPFFMATEIYKPQKRWEKMAEMLDEAMRRNSEQKLEKAFFLESDQKRTKDNISELYIDTIEKAVAVYRDEAWTTLYNESIENLNAGNNEVVLEKLNLCIKINPKRSETYRGLVSYYVSNNNLSKAREYIDLGLSLNPSYALYAMGSELLEEEFRLSKNENNILGDMDFIIDAEKMCLQAIKMAENENEELGSLKIKLFLLNLEMGKNQKAIDISDELLDIYYDNPDLYFNVGILYQRLATQLYDPSAEAYGKLNAEDTLDPDMVIKIYQDFMQAKIYAEKSKNKFLEANDLETEDTGSREAAAEMRSLIKNLKNIYIPSIQEIAASQGITLD